MTIYERVASCIKQNKKAVLITAVDKKGNGPVDIGTQMLVTEDDERYGTVGGGKLELHAMKKSLDIFKSKKPLQETYLLNDGEIVKDALTLSMVCGGRVTLYYDYIGPKVSVYIFGAGHIGQALIKTLKPLNYKLTIIDPREEYLNLCENDIIKVHSSYIDYLEKEQLDEQSYAVCCTPSHEADYSVIRTLIKQKAPLKYMGMLSSSKKLKGFLDELYKDCGHIKLSNFYSPIGLDLGGGSPTEIALSIASEILMIHHGKETAYSMRESRQKHLSYWKSND